MNGRRIPIALATASMLLACLPVAAQNALTIYGGGAWGGSFDQASGTGATADLAASGAGALSIDWPLDAARNVQVFASG